MLQRESSWRRSLKCLSQMPARPSRIASNGHASSFRYSSTLSCCSSQHCCERYMPSLARQHYCTVVAPPHRQSTTQCCIHILCKWHTSSNCFVDKRSNHQMRVEHPSMSCVPSAQHSCNAEAVSCINDAHADLLVIKVVMTPTLACRVVLTSMHV